LLSQVLAYLEAFADRFHLQPLIRFNTRVVRLDHAQHGTHVPHQNGHSSSSNPQHEQIEGNAHDRWTVVSQPADAGKQVRILSSACPASCGNIHDVLEPCPILSALISYKIEFMLLQAAPLMEEGFDAVVICTGNYHEPNLVEATPTHDSHSRDINVLHAL